MSYLPISTTTSLLARIAIWCFLPAFLVFGVGIGYLASFKLSSLEIAAVSFGGIMLVGGAAYWFRHVVFRLVSHVELGEDIRLSTLTGLKVYPWSNLGRMVVQDAKERALGSVCEVRLMTTDDSVFSVWLPTTIAEEALMRARTKPWARDWPGAPIDSNTLLAIFVLGAIAVTMGGISTYQLVIASTDIFRQGELGRTELIVRMIVTAVIGLPAVIFSVYQYLRKPIYYRPAICKASQEGDVVC